MRLRGLLPILWGFLALLAILGAVAGWLNPSSRDLNEALAAAKSEIPKIRTSRDGLVGAAYVRDLDGARTVVSKTRADLGDELRRQAALVSRWFPRLGQGGSFEERVQDFENTYRWAQDELKRELTGILAARRGDEVVEVPFYAPPFLTQKRLPQTEAEMEAAQKAFNVERLLLVSAAKAQALPYKAMDLRAGWEAAPEDARFTESRVVLHLEMPGASLPTVMKALCELEGEGPIVRIEGLETRPRKLPKKLDEASAPMIEADIRMVLSVFRTDT